MFPCNYTKNHTVPAYTSDNNEANSFNRYALVPAGPSGSQYQTPYHPPVQQGDFQYSGAESSGDASNSVCGQYGGHPETPAENMLNPSWEDYNATNGDASGFHGDDVDFNKFVEYNSYLNQPENTSAPVNSVSKKRKSTEVKKYNIDDYSNPEKAKKLITLIEGARDLINKITTLDVKSYIIEHPTKPGKFTNIHSLEKSLLNLKKVEINGKIISKNYASNIKLVPNPDFGIVPGAPENITAEQLRRRTRVPNPDFGTKGRRGENPEITVGAFNRRKQKEKQRQRERQRIT
jgi:hypothetical protein